jgi:hypothetical protein
MPLDDSFRLLVLIFLAFSWARALGWRSAG